ncbi:PREDICTED: triacylglycerol lipase 2-like [Nelumbo nucifera]|uniref:Lipase n=1 Tax=Nelumbo nucifera TaxID=4432 RepID=A0A1U7ZWV4_NELNU|nr:PREDICTED: triacylglycerol lipase 2-like [Nelumbo nucifera]
MATVLRLVLLVIIFCGSAPGARTQELDVNQEAGLAPLPQVANYGICKSMVEIHGYVCQEHTVTTEDGYILSLQRIPAGRSSGDTPQERRPVLLQHGVLVDGAIWLLNLPHQSLAFILADGGFDVWIANSRGTKWSRGHTSLSSDDPAYWDWSWDQFVEYDLPATFQYVHHQTGKKIYYVGHSQGTLIALASFSQEKLLNLLKSAALLSPIAYLGQVPCPLARSAAEVFIAEVNIQIITNFWLGVDEFDPKGKAVDKLLKAICNKPGINCYNLFTSFTGKNCCLNSSTVDFFLEYEPQSTATKNMIHLAQMIRGGSITMYDYGDKDKNVKHYGQPTPPVYNMSGIPSDIPLYLSYGGKDKLSDVNDIQALLYSLKDHDRDKLVVQYQEDYAHADFVMAMNAKQMVYDSPMAFFRLH